MAFKWADIKPDFKDYALESRFSKVSVTSGIEGMRFAIRDKISGKDYEIKFSLSNLGGNTRYTFGIVAPVLSEYGSFDNGPKKLGPVFYANDKVTAYICALELTESIMREKRKMFGDLQILRERNLIVSFFEKVDQCLEAYKRFKSDITNMSEVHAD